ncbi:MAG: isoleucine--tRNA ligase [Patescibacteria group bacterium]|jgi:isoleucyl-tRNA synthetase
MSDEQKILATSAFPQMEEEVLKFWAAADIFNKTLQKDAPHGEYVFYDGPPFATGTPHYGHIVASIMKDVVPRYQTMRGYRVERKWGWDCHGLPVENIVEKELGTKSKKDIEDLGVEKFNDLCRSKVLTYVDEWKKVITRLGRWADMENAYKTMDLDFMDSIWWAFKRLWDEGLIYKDYRSMHICPRCETTLSQSEVTEGYRDIKDLSVIAKFQLIDEPNTFVLAWTTTPWTLIGNVALAVGGEIKYVKIKCAETNYILAKARLNDVFKDQPYEIIDEFDGDDLVGRAYQPLFDYYSVDKTLVNRENGWKIYEANFVTTTDGTGVVHIAPAFGEDDMNLGKAKNLPFIQHVGLDGVFKSEVKDFPGLHVKPKVDHTATDIEIIKYLAAHGTLFQKAKYEHSYPHCWRCDTPLINYATSSWFVAVTKIKDRLLKNAKNINWSPDYIKEGRFGNWLEGARDWSISRQRFWASAIPIWECACGERQVVGSVVELEKLTGTKITDIHKDKVDLLTFKCSKCSGEMKRVSDVIDCWFESGSMPFAQLHYPIDNKDKFEHNFPAQFIAEGVDQTRAWFYYLHVIAGGIFQERAFNNVIVNGIVLAEDGKKMSKRLHNYPDPLVVMEKYGSDALRAYLAASPVMQAENLNFSERGVQESLRKNIMILWNVYKFYEMFAAESSEELKENKKVSENILDQWILAKLKTLVSDTTEALESYNLPKALRPITEFIDELSTWYLRRSRDRFKSADVLDKQMALATTKYVLTVIAKLMAPFTPFIAENLWQKVSGFNFKDDNRSVHLEAWPVVSLKKPSIIGRALEMIKHSKEDQQVLDNMLLVRRIVELGLAKRDEAGIKIRQMLAGLEVRGVAELSLEYAGLIKEELNIKELVFTDLTADKLTVKLDTVLTPELKLEGIKRELIRSINLLRKENNLSLNDRVSVYYQAPAELAEALASVRAEVIKDTLSLDFSNGVSTDNIAQKEIKIDGFSIFLSLQK